LPPFCGTSRTTRPGSPPWQFQTRVTGGNHPKGPGVGQWADARLIGFMTLQRRTSCE
jgi:hypothetical protein